MKNKEWGMVGKMKGLKWDDIPQDYIGWCVKRIIRDDLNLSKKILKRALESFYSIKVIEEK